MSKIIKIKEAKFSKLTNDEYAHFVRSVEKLVVVATPKKLGVSEQLAQAFKANVERLTDASRHSRTSNETADLAKIDKQRGEIVVYLFTMIRNERKTPLEAKRKAATALYNATKTFQGLQLLPNRSKTQAIESLLFDLSKPENAEHVRALMLSDVVSELSALNKKYDALIIQRADSQIENAVESPKKIRVQTNEQYDEISLRAMAFNIYQPSEESKNFMLSLNKLIEDTNVAYKQRLGRNKKAERA